MIHSDAERFTFENGVMFQRVKLDGVEIRAGITIEALDRLILRAGFSPDQRSESATLSHVLCLLTPTIEAYVQTKHFTQGANGELVIIDVTDLVVH